MTEKINVRQPSGRIQVWYLVDSFVSVLKYMYGKKSEYSVGEVREASKRHSSKMFSRLK